MPVHNEVVYAERVAEQGNSDLLVQRAIRGVNHCGFTATELVTAFSDLVAWTEFGVKPAGDDWLDPVEVVAGHRDNLKVTQKGDLELAEFLLNRWKGDE